MECRTAIVRDVRGGRALQPDERESLAEAFLWRRAFRGILARIIHGGSS